MSSGMSAGSGTGSCSFERQRCFTHACRQQCPFVPIPWILVSSNAQWQSQLNQVDYEVQRLVTCDLQGAARYMCFEAAIMPQLQLSGTPFDVAEHLAET